ncbi:MAG: homocysteine S-methyltransferase family protein, partial [Deltaproteobacteria bacterium]|nr:homocysteine S-methyltransferase family protein [Deltaproteobacteria bacterium]
MIILDGSMGALLQKRGLPNGYAPDLWNLERPEIIQQVHREYFEAGARLLLTNTFGSTEPRLAEYGAAERCREITHAAVANLRKVVKDQAYVGGDIGPLGLTVEPTGDLPFDQAIQYFYNQAKALAEGGADLIVIETMFDLCELRAAVIGAKEGAPSLPILAHMTFNVDGMTDTGTDPKTAAVVLEGLGVDIVGVNCSTGPQQMLPVLQAMGEATSLPLSIQPNAGLPVIKNGEAVFPLTAEEIVEYAIPFWQAGANLIGGCCGTTPLYIQMLAQAMEGRKPIERSLPAGLKITNRSRVLEIGANHPFVLIGEKINPTGRKKFSKAIEEGKTDLIVQEAKKQVEAGATALDINVGVPLIDEAAMMDRAIRAVQAAVDVPLVIDSSFTSAIERGLKIYAGKALVNSVNAEEERLEEILPLVKRYGAAVIALVAGDEIPERAAERLKCAEKILRRGEDLGIPRNRFIFDVLSLTVSAAQSAACETLETIRLIKREFGCPTSMGLSNVSFGLPFRHLINRTFLAQAIYEGLDAAILDPFDSELKDTIAAATLFSQRDPGCKYFISLFQGRDEKSEKKGAGSSPSPSSSPTRGEEIGKKEGEEIDREGKTPPKTTRDLIFDAVVEGDRDGIVPLVHRALAEGEKPLPLFTDTLTPAIRHLGDLFGQRKKFIPHLIAAAEAMKAGVAILTPLLEAEGPKESKGTIVFATVKGDIHDIGKNICILMLKNFGYNVIDLGRNVPAETIIMTAKEQRAEIIALSALMTTTMMQMKVVIEAVKKEGLSTKVMIGGAVVTPR